MRSSVSLVPILLLASCSASSETRRPVAPTAPERPVLVSLPPEAGQVEGPSGTAGAGAASRYDEVGLATWYGEEVTGNQTASGATFSPTAITAAHRILPLGSYAEITALDTGRTILVLINDRGPDRDDRLIDLSRGAAAMLGTGTNPMSPVRVRAVTATPQDAAALTAGRSAAARLPAPPALLAALRRKLGNQPAASMAATSGRALAKVGKAPESSRKLTVPVSDVRYRVQVAAFSTEVRARALARRLGGRVEGAGGLWRVRLGPFADQAGARRARDAAAQQGYGDAAIITQ